MPKVLIIDDDTSFLLMIKTFLEKKNYQARGAKSAFDGLNLLSRESFDVIILDFKMPDKNGLEVLKDIRNRNLQTPVILMTSYVDIKTAVHAIKLGAYDYVTKPINNDELHLLLQRVLNKSTEQKTAGKTDTQGLDFVQGESESSRKIQEYIQLVAPTNLSVIIQGESGTGKEYVARMIHMNSNRKNKPFVAIDCGALTKDLAASELFGHMKGSFTGAIADKNGHFEEANEGTIFLDEIGNLSYEVQVKLLRAIQERKVRKVGSNKDIDVDVRIIAATNEDLSGAVKNSNFREDLYHRINEFSLTVPSLRDRKEDLVVFADHFLKNANQELGREVNGFSEEAMDYLKNYSWPGNLRELKNLVKRSVLLCFGEEITTDLLPEEIMEGEQATATTNGLPGNYSTSDLKAVAERNEREIIISTLKEVGYNKSKAARKMNIDRKTLYNKLKLYGIDT